MIKATQWQGQDVLRLNEDQWLEVLQNNNMVDGEILKMIKFVYRQPDCSSTASDIADHFRVHYNQVTAWNRRLSKKLYDKFSQEPPGDLEGTRWIGCIKLQSLTTSG